MVIHTELAPEAIGTYSQSLFVGANPLGSGNNAIG